MGLREARSSLGRSSETFMLVDAADYKWPEPPCQDFGTRKDNSYKDVPPK